MIDTSSGFSDSQRAVKKNSRRERNTSLGGYVRLPTHPLHVYSSNVISSARYIPREYACSKQHTSISKTPPNVAARRRQIATFVLHCEQHQYQLPVQITVSHSQRSSAISEGTRAERLCVFIFSFGLDRTAAFISITNVQVQDTRGGRSEEHWGGGCGSSGGDGDRRGSRIGPRWSGGQREDRVWSGGC